MAWTFIGIINIITITLLLLFSFFLFTHKKGKTLSNRILAVFLLSKALSIIDFNFYIFKEYIFVYFPHLVYIGSSFAFLWGPSIYFYTKSLAYRDFSFKKRHMLHLLPFIIYWIALIFNYQMYSAEVKRQLLLTVMLFNVKNVFIMRVVLHILIIIYIVASLRILRNYQIEIKKIFSAIEHINLSWLRFILVVFILMWIVYFLNIFIWLKTGTPLFMLSLLTIAISFIFAIYILYKGLKQPELFSGIEERPKYEKSPLTKKDSVNYANQLEIYMDKEKPYLIPSLSLNELAEKMAISARYLSQVINEIFGKNFFDFINSYRVEEAKHYLLDSSDKHSTILEISFNVGFNSKTAFNRAFKKHAGMSPTEFKELHSI